MHGPFGGIKKRDSAPAQLLGVLGVKTGDLDCQYRFLTFLLYPDHTVDVYLIGFRCQAASDNDDGVDSRIGRGHSGGVEKYLKVKKSAAVRSHSFPLLITLLKRMPLVSAIVPNIWIGLEAGNLIGPRVHRIYFAVVSLFQKGGQKYAAGFQAPGHTDHCHRPGIKKSVDLCNQIPGKCHFDFYLSIVGAAFQPRSYEIIKMISRLESRSHKFKTDSQKFAETEL